MKSFLVAIKNVLLWSYERGTWQYDLLCLLIIAAIFLLPGKYFGDRDRLSVKTVRSVEANQLSTFASNSGGIVREIAISDLQSYLQKQNRPELMLNAPQEAIRFYLSDQLNQDVSISKFEPIINPQGRVGGYRVWIK